MILRLFLVTLILTCSHIKELKALDGEQDKLLLAVVPKVQAPKAVPSTSERVVKPNFVVNTIVHVPSSFKPLDSIDQYRVAVVGLPYYIEKDINTKNPRRGKLWRPQQVPTPNENARRVSRVLGSFFDKVLREGFEENSQLSSEAAPSRIGIATLLNRMRSVCNTSNQEFFNMVDDLPSAIEHKVIMSLWEPQWVKRELTTSGQVHCVPVGFDEVAVYYEDLEKKDINLAHAFLQVNEHEHLNSIVPYRELRELLLKDEATRGLVRSSRARNSTSPVYVAFMDADVLSFRTGAKGVFSCYEEAVSRSQVPLHGLTTGYTISINQDPFASLGVSFDLGERQALSTVFPLAPYFPEPNAALLVLDGQDTLEVSFPETFLDNPAKRTQYTSPQEVPLLITEIVKARFKGSKVQASPHFRFLSEGAIETELPSRFLQNHKKKDGTKNAKEFNGRFSSQTGKFEVLSHQDLTHVRNTSQSHLKSRDWGTYVYNYLGEYMGLDSVQLVNVNQPGAIVKKRKDQFLISMFSSLHSVYSPVALTLREVEARGYNLVEYLFSFVKDYASMTSGQTLRITYGEGSGSKVKSTKPTGDLLRKHITTYEGFLSIIDKFYIQPIARSVLHASQVCGMAELPVIVRYIQLIPVALPKILTLQAPEKPQEMQQPAAVQLSLPGAAAGAEVPELPVPVEAPAARAGQPAHQPAIVYPAASLTLPNVKTLLVRLNRRCAYATIDGFAAVTEGNSWRVANKAKTLSPIVGTIWTKFATSTWDQVLTGLNLKIQDLTLVLNADSNGIQLAKDNNSRFVDAFFILAK